ncbi:hypothetical protein EKO04_002337 [Ascochyta lentis]|uniref:Uncharacterized protein n=1 Tax=Ascochyta lentis TaxID=205686 RepID=A0A8H7MKZ3_9PLEO|nr:hypothetical protein EKO04_002337 [Ascochyta lentis]
MDYYHCSLTELYLELQRRNYMTFGSRDQLSEGLRADDDVRGSEATTVKTEVLTAFAPREISLMRTAEFGQTVPVFQLVNQRIVYWVLNTFFPTLQLFFESGLSCTIDGGQLPGAIVGLDPKLRFRLTDSTHEEEGRVTRGMLPKKFAHPGASIRILEATVAQRTSIAMKPIISASLLHSSKALSTAIVREIHTVIGLRLNGMDEMSYVWAKVEAPTRMAGNRQWGDVRLAGLKTDIPVPSLGLTAEITKPEGELTVVEKGSMIRLPLTMPGGLSERGHAWI